jgi:hypothetical protein
MVPLSRCRFTGKESMPTLPKISASAAKELSSALDYFSWRARYDDTVDVPETSEELREYYDLVHPTHHRELGDDYNEMLAKQAEVGRAYAQQLLDAEDLTRVLDRWRDWLADAQTAKEKMPWHPSLQALFDEVGTADRALVAQIAEHLRIHGGLLTGYASGLSSRSSRAPQRKRSNAGLRATMSAHAPSFPGR